MKQLPRAPESEMVVAGSALMDPIVYDDLAAHLTADHFTSPRVAALWRAVGKARANAGVYDPALALRYLEADPESGDARETIEECFRYAAPAVARHHANEIARCAVMRELIAGCESLAHDAYETPSGESDSLVERAEQLVYGLRSRSQADEPIEWLPLTRRTLDALDARRGSGKGHVPTGYRDLDKVCGGLVPGEMVVVAGRPSMGKTALGLNIAARVARNLGNVAVFSLEMTSQALAERLLCAAAQVSSQALRAGDYGDEELRRLSVAAGERAEWNLVVDDKPVQSVSYMRARARRLASRKPLDLIVVDYLQLIAPADNGRRGDSRQVQVAEMSAGIKAMAREMGCAVMCLSQLNRSNESRENKRPMLSDLRESGAIEQDADVVMFLHREPYYHKHDPEWLEMNGDSDAEVIVAKNRNGPVGVAHLQWVPDYAVFKDLRAMAGEARAC